MSRTYEVSAMAGPWFCTCPTPLLHPVGECTVCGRIPENICSARRRVAPDPQPQALQPATTQLQANA